MSDTATVQPESSTAKADGTGCLVGCLATFVLFLGIVGWSLLGVLDIIPSKYDISRYTAPVIESAETVFMWMLVPLGILALIAIVLGLIHPDTRKNLATALVAALAIFAFQQLLGWVLKSLFS